MNDRAMNSGESSDRRGPAQRPVQTTESRRSANNPEGVDLDDILNYDAFLAEEAAAERAEHEVEEDMVLDFEHNVATSGNNPWSDPNYSQYREVEAEILARRAAEAGHEISDDVDEFGHPVHAAWPGADPAPVGHPFAHLFPRPATTTDLSRAVARRARESVDGEPVPNPFASMFPRPTPANANANANANASTATSIRTGPKKIILTNRAKDKGKGKAVASPTPSPTLPSRGITSFTPGNSSPTRAGPSSPVVAGPSGYRVSASALIQDDPFDMGTGTSASGTIGAARKDGFGNTANRTSTADSSGAQMPTEETVSLYCSAKSGFFVYSAVARMQSVPAQRAAAYAKAEEERQSAVVLWHAVHDGPLAAGQQGPDPNALVGLSQPVVDNSVFWDPAEMERQLEAEAEQRGIFPKKLNKED